MKHTIILIAILATYTSLSASKFESYVYICKGKSSKKYHYSPNCRGLSNCSTDTYKVSLSKARQINRTLWGWED